MAGDKFRVVRSQKDDAVSYILHRYRLPYFQPQTRLHQPPHILLLRHRTRLKTRPQQRRHHAPWGHAVDAYPVRAQLHTRRPHQPQNGVLRHCVVRELRRPHARRHARRAHDAPPHAPLHHRPRRVLHTRRHSAGVDRHDPVVHGQVQLQNGLLAGAADASVAEHDVEAAVNPDRRFDQALDLVLVGHVAMDVDGAVGTDRCGDVLAFLVLDVRDHDSPHPVQGEFARGTFADAAGAAGDDRDLALKLFVVFLNGCLAT